MANKKILVSNNSGSLEEVASSSVYYDDSTNKIIATDITASNITSSYANNGFVLVNNKTIGSSTQYSGASGSVLKFSGSSYSATLATGIGGDLSGSVDGQVKAISVSNIASGTLPYAQGGTGLGSSTNGVLIKGSGNTMSTLSASNSGSVIGLFNSPSGPYWAIDDTDPTTNYKPRLDVYTSPGTWTKTGNPRFIKVLVIGGGGGGSGGGNAPGLAVGGNGGGGGGASEIVFEANQINSATITIGNGGAGSPGRTGGPSTYNSVAASNGGTTIFSNGTYSISATGGGGGAASATLIGGISGGGNIPQISDGGAGAPNQASNNGKGGVYVSGGGSGGSGTASPWPGGDSGNPFVNRDYFNIASGGGGYPAPGQDGKLYIVPLFNVPYYLNNSTSTSPASSLVLGTGGGGGGGAFQGQTDSSIRGGNGAYGGGGGGGGGCVRGVPAPSYYSGYGGTGGAGIALVYSY